MNNFDAGYVFELFGLIYYGFFVFTMRKRNGRYSQRSRVLVIVAAIVMVASQPAHYATSTLGQVAIVVVALASLVSMFLDTRANRAG